VGMKLRCSEPTADLPLVHFSLSMLPVSLFVSSLIAKKKKEFIGNMLLATALRKSMCLARALPRLAAMHRNDMCMGM